MMNSESEAKPSEPVSAFIDNRHGGQPPSAGEMAARREEGAGRVEEVAVRRGEFTILDGAGASVIYEIAVRCFIEMGRPAVLVDGGCQADPYEVAAIAKRIGREGTGAGCRGPGAGTTTTDDGSSSPGTRHPAPGTRELVDAVLRNIYVARAFTAHQMEALIVERLGPMVERVRPVFVGVLSLDALFRDDELDRYESRVMRARCAKTLRRMAKDSNLMVAATEGAGRTGAGRIWG